MTSASRFEGDGTGRRRRVPLRLRAVLAFGFTSLVLASTLAGVAYVLVREALVDERESAAMREAYLNARLVRARLRPVDPDVTGLLGSLQVGPSGDAMLRFDGEWFSSSVSLDQSSLPSSLRDTVEDGSAARQVQSTDDGPRLAVGVPIGEADAAYYEVTSLAEVEGALDVLGSSLAIAAGLAAVAGAAAGASITGTVFRPLRHTAEVAGEISGGDLDRRLEVAGDRDLDPLVESFNEMVSELAERIRRETRFASDVSHELRGPLTALAGAVEVVHRRRHELPDDAVVAVAALEDQVASFNQLVLDLLEISRFEAGTAQLSMRNVDLHEFIRAVLTEHPGDPPTLKSETDMPLRVDLDPRRMQQVVTNVLDNGERYAGGVRSITLAPSDSAGAVRIVLDDEGDGVSVSERQAIFRRFERGAAASRPRAPSGTGLGLALSAQHVGLHGGQIWVEDAPGGGARFVIDLPVAKP